MDDETIAKLSKMSDLRELNKALAELEANMQNELSDL